MTVLFGLLDVLTVLIIVDAVLSWVIPSTDRFPRNLTDAVTRPIYAPIRKVLRPERTGGIDLSPLIAIFAIRAVQQMLVRLLAG